MDVSTQLTNRVLAAGCATAFAIPAVGFVGMLAKTVLVTLIGEDAWAYRNGTVLTAAGFFFAIATVCGFISYKFFDMARRGFQEK